MSARTTRTRLFAATAVALAALAVTACDNGKGVRDEGPSAASGSSAGPSASQQAPDSTAKPTGNGGGAAGGSSGGTTGTAGPGSSAGTSSSTGRSRNVACDGATTRTTATEVSRPLNHILLTVTNTGGRNCDLTGYPAVRFGEAQAVPPAAEETKPQAVVTLAPGESGYAGVLLAAGDGSGEHGYTARTLEVFFGGGSGGRSARPALPAKGVYVDDHLTVTYWQSGLDDALSY